VKSKPSGAIQQTITLLEQEIDALEQRRGELLRVIDSLRPLAGEASIARGRRKTAAKRNERTNERARRGPTRSLPDDGGEAIIAQLKKHAGTMTPGALAKALKISRPNLRYQIKPLEKAGRVVSSGATMNRQVSLPGRAKEAP